MKLRGRVAVVTGASRGIGLAVARRLAAEGARLAITARDGKALDEAAASLQGAGAEVICVAGDVTDERYDESLAQAVQRQWGAADILVNNAGNARSAPFLKTDRALWDSMLAINATSAFLVTRAFLPGMVQRGYGRIVVIASIAGKRGAPYIAAYSASKFAVLGMVSSLASEMAGKGITVNAVCPGYVDTPMTEGSVQNISARTGKSREEARAILAAMNPQGRLILPDEVAAKVLEFSLEECTRTGEAVDL